jgi:vitamin B12 transporter
MHELNPWGTANENLNPENIYSFDTSLEYKNVKVTYFYNEIKDMIDWSNGGYDNLDGISIIKGIEAEYTQELIEDKLAFSSNYTFLSARDKDGYLLQRRPRHSAKLGFDYYATEELHLGLDANYVGDRVEYAYGTHNITAHTGKYTILNLVTNYKLNKKVSFYGKVDNLTDKYYQVVDGYATAGRSFYFGMNAKY